MPTYSIASAKAGRYIRHRSIIADHPIRAPPSSRMLLTPNDPKLSTLPYPKGNFGVGGFNAHEIVARVMKSLTRSVKECTASASSAGTSG